MALLSQQKSRFGSSLMQRKSLALLCSVMFSLGAASTAQAQQDKDILALFDQGEALRSQGAFLESRNIWLQAYYQVRLWE